ncbi:hypothetical protein HID58_029176 [Brassica napus]|uniref:Uncharacterized protein n=1 Tax=Brassica napus TaxID=3708 RepID=A0ABQ8CCF1_BRANA|nr:hypothetical protein HID58_029176 [Brassica napus]
MLLSDLKTGCCKETVVTRLLRFWEARTVKKGGGAYGCGHGGLYISSLFSDVRYCSDFKETDCDFFGCNSPENILICTHRNKVKQNLLLEVPTPNARVKKPHGANGLESIRLR